MQSLADQLLSILDNRMFPLSSRDLASQLDREIFCSADYEVTRALRSLLRQGLVTLKDGRWTSVRVHTTHPVMRPEVLRFPNISLESARLLGYAWQQGVSTPVGISSNWIDDFVPGKAPGDDHGRWGKFRRLLEYYRQCVRTECGAEASSYLDKAGSQFIYLRQFGSWFPRRSHQWSLSIPIGTHMEQFIKQLPDQDDDQAVVVGYPLQIVRIRKEFEPDIVLALPVFFFHVCCSWSHGALSVTANEPRPEVNLKWLENAFFKDPDKQRNFLSACGLLGKRAADDEFPEGSPDQSSPDLDNLCATLAVFMSKHVLEPLHITSVNDTPLDEGIDTGILNRAVLMLSRRTQFTATLLKELAAIGQAPDTVLDQTALRHIFADDSKDSSKSEQSIHEELVADLNLLNPEQRQAVASLLTNNVTVVTGPPGTGKSQVVSGAAVNARLKGQSLLFASRNHKAIDAVVGRLISDSGEPLVVRCNSKQDPNLKFAFEHAIRARLAEPYDADAVERIEKCRSEMTALLKTRGIKGRLVRTVARLGEDLGRLEDQLRQLSPCIPGEMRELLDSSPEIIPVSAVERVLSVVHDLLLNLDGGKPRAKLAELVGALKLLPWYHRARKSLKEIPQGPLLPLWPWPSKLKALGEIVPLLESAVGYSRARIECAPLEKKLRELPALDSLVSELSGLTKRIADLAPKAVELDLASRRGLPPQCSRQEFDGLHAAISAMRTGLQDGLLSAKTLSLLQERSPVVLDGFPCWAVTSLSVGSRIPLVPGLFDLTVIDEASQSDIPSAIPLLYRAKRAGVVGDPFQLTHVANLSESKDTMLRRQMGVLNVEDERFAYCQRSLYDLFSSTDGVDPVFLSETYRSADEIAAYSNIISYKGRLRVATDSSRFKTPRGMRPGLWWTEGVGKVESGGRGGCHCPDEVEKIVRLVNDILLKNDFKGTLGVVTPFRMQANRLQSALFEAGSSEFYDALVRADTHVDTAHGFQGDERDVIIFSLCAGPEMPSGSKHFLRDSVNLFNVAVSRARAVVHVVGNRAWARRCGIRHIEVLAADIGQVIRPEEKGPWYPHESPYEKMLFDALQKAGLEPRPQFKVPGRRLDIALIGQDEPPRRFDIEVDGDCHRNSDGTRKLDDAWRDIQLQAMGWKVMRFWTYQLREDLDGCVNKIVSAWRNNE